MKKNLLALSIAAMVGGIAGGANAQVVIDTTGVGGRLISNAANFGRLVAPAVGVRADQLTPTTTGIGHVLVVPYFTTQGENSTEGRFSSLLNIVNNDQENAKAVKLRYRGAANSDDLFDITIFLSPGDMWTANVSAGTDGLSFITTSDTSCTLPSAADIKASGGKFKTDRVMNADVKETREGYIEILNMADIPSARTRGVVGETALFTAVKHATVSGEWKAPCTSTVMDLQANPLVANDLVNDPVARGYSWPTGGLSANWTLVNTDTKASFTGEAVALRATPNNTIDVPGAANLVFSPQTADPVSVGDVARLTADPLLQGLPSVVRAASYDFPDLSTPYVNSAAATTPIAQANELSRNLATFAVQNEYITNSLVSFATDWVFSMPTRRYAVALNYGNNQMVFNAVPSDYFTLQNTSLDKNKRICVDSGKQVAYDREEKSRTTFTISPGETLKFCGETSVLGFNGKASVLNAKLAFQNIDTTFADGWLQIKTPGINDKGLPVVGYAAAKAVGNNSSNFGGVWVHRNIRNANQAF